MSVFNACMSESHNQKSISLKMLIVFFECLKDSLLLRYVSNVALENSTRGFHNLSSLFALLLSSFPVGFWTICRPFFNCFWKKSHNFYTKCHKVNIDFCPGNQGLYKSSTFMTEKTPMQFFCVKIYRRCSFSDFLIISFLSGELTCFVLVCVFVYVKVFADYLSPLHHHSSSDCLISLKTLRHSFGNTHCAPLTGSSSCTLIFLCVRMKKRTYQVKRKKQ